MTANLVCQCCAAAIDRADTLECERNCADNHLERVAKLSEGGAPTLAEPEGPRFSGLFTCAGCGDDSYGYGGRITLKR